jgi:uncharacterized membrane protein HdeD (DUF308 family)
MATILDRNTLQTMRDALLAANWWAAAIRGVSAIVLGLLAVSLPTITLLGLVIIFAVYCLVDGVFAIVLAVRGARKHQRWGWLAFNGVVSLIVSGLAFFYPFVTIIVLVALFAAWALISGAATIMAGMKLAKGHGRWWLVAGGVIAIVFGLLMLFLPTLGMLTLIYLVGLQALFAGITLLVLAFRLRARSVEISSAGGIAPGAGPSARAAEATQA